jgi:hypothetical protein
MYRHSNGIECFPIVDAASGQCQEYLRSAIGLKPGTFFTLKGSSSFGRKAFGRQKKRDFTITQWNSTD